MNQGTSSPYQFQGTWDGRTSTTINLLDKNETVQMVFPSTFTNYREYFVSLR